MAIIKCKMCGGDLALTEGQSVAECEYCGTLQTVPNADNEKKLNLFASANKLRLSCEFDRAAGIYDAIKAEFPIEAEAYWGLVLCKYGIEYVDDPATGKKIPTCHRLSYDSVLDDANLELAMDYADTAARRVYREEARHLEKLRTGILEVSSQEKPYDIFLCYKETDENGDRTLDSVLAQNLYTALTERGYRVFFSRITLQSKLGEAYEPYIFAALNSAKVMLAIGTDPEYYSAVWVKNEWSRYLKICAEDKTRHLIPCYKDMDAYDLPREFRPLQGVDLGKMGADQDILFNMEKYIPLQKKVLVQEKVVVGGTGGSNKIASLLDRGNMALEDGDWAKADSFFEDVLNNDSKNAQAYIGKTLAQEKCRTMDSLVRKCRDAHQNVAAETLYIKEKTAHISEKAKQYALPGYVEEHTIRELYRFDLSYTSEVSGRQKQYREEENWWQNHRQLSRAEKFAAGDVAEHLQSEKKHLFAQLNERVKKAQEADARSVSRLEAAYDAHIAEGDRRAEAIYNDGLARRKKDYETWLAQAKKETAPDALKKLAQNFAGLGDYQDSRNLAEHCRKRAAEEQAKLDAEAERKRKAQQKRTKTIAIVSAACIVLAVTVTLVVTKVIIPGNKYKAAVALMENGQYAEAIAAFEAMDGYKDSETQIMNCKSAWETAEQQRIDAEMAEKFSSAEELMAAGDYDGAIAIFETLADYEGSADGIAVAEGKKKEVAYAAAEALCDNGEAAKAAIAFGKLGDYKDSRERSLELWNALPYPYETIGAGRYHTAALLNNGTVKATGHAEYGQCDTASWEDVIAISVGNTHTVGLKPDGTVIGVGSDYEGCLQLSDWTDIVFVSAGGGHTVGIKADGSVIATGAEGDGQCNVSGWKDIIAVSAGDSHTVGLKADGTVVAVGRNESGQCDVSGWTDIIAISAGNKQTVALKSNGTVVTAGSKIYLNQFTHSDQVETSKWRDIVSVCAGWDYVIGLKADGTAVVSGFASYRWDDGAGWSDIVAISAKENHILGLKSDGTMIAAGDNHDYRCNVSSWKNIKLPNNPS